MLSLLRRRSAPVPAPAAPAAAAPAGACSLLACRAGASATVVGVHCGDAEACRLRTLGLCEGARVQVMEERGCTLLEVRGARLALGKTLAAGITVLPLHS